METEKDYIVNGEFCVRALRQEALVDCIIDKYADRQGISSRQVQPKYEDLRRILEKSAEEIVPIKEEGDDEQEKSSRYPQYFIRNCLIENIWGRCYDDLGDTAVHKIHLAGSKANVDALENVLRQHHLYWCYETVFESVQDVENLDLRTVGSLGDLIYKSGGKIGKD